MRTHRAFALAALCMALLLAIVGTSSASVVAKKKRPAYKLAVIDSESVPDPATVRQYKIPLNSIAAKCTNKKIRLADMTVASRGLLSDEGLDYSLLEILQQVNLSIPTGTPAQPCEDVFAAWVLLTLP